MLRGGQAGGRPGRRRGALLAGLVSPHHAGHARPCLPGGHAGQAQRLPTLRRGRRAVPADGRSQCERDPPSHQPFVARGWIGPRAYLRLVRLAPHASSRRQTMPLESTRPLSRLKTKNSTVVHGAPPCCGEAACPRLTTALRPPRSPPSGGGWLGSEAVAGLRRKHRLASIGISGCFASERAALWSA